MVEVVKYIVLELLGQVPIIDVLILYGEHFVSIFDELSVFVSFETSE